MQIIFEGKKLKVGACGGNNEIGIDDVILTSWSGTEQCTLRTTTTSVSVSHYQPSVSTVVTTQPVSVPQETTVPFTKTSSSSDGLNITTENGIYIIIIVFKCLLILFHQKYFEFDMHL